MTLRERCIEAMDDAVTDDGYWHLPSGRIEKGFDAVLAVLAGHADEWKYAAYEKVADTDPDVFGSAALAVLKEDE